MIPKFISLLLNRIKSYKKLIVLALLPLLAAPAPPYEPLALKASLGSYIHSEPPLSGQGSVNTNPEVTTTIVFTGDINLGRCIAQAAVRAEDFAFSFRLVAERLSSADITVGSLDSSISDQSPSMPCPTSMNLIGPEKMVEGLQVAGFDTITVATNHAKDCGEKGFDCKGASLLDTINTLKKAGIEPIGGGGNLAEARRPVILENGGIRFAFLGVDQINPDVWAKSDIPGVAPLSNLYLDKVLADIKEANKIADVVIVLPQWGEEYSLVPAEYQREWAKKFHEAGATLVVGNHPHLIQPVEEFPQGVTFYALGNFVFDQEDRSRREGIVIEAVFSGKELKEWKAHPILINYYTFQTEWVVDNAVAGDILERTQVYP